MAKDKSKELEFDDEAPETSDEDDTVETDLPSEKEEDVKPESENSDDNAEMESELADSEEPALKPEKQDIEDESTFTPQESEAEKAPAKETAPAVSPESQLDRYKNFIDEYKQLQQHRQRMDTATALLAAGGKIGQSIAGKYSGNFNPDLTGLQLVQQAANRPVTDFEQGQIVQGRGIQLQGEMAANDPNSSQSVMVRQYLQQRFPNITVPPNLTYADSSAFLKNVGKPLNSRFQSKVGLYTDDEGKQHKINASFDPTTGKIYNPSTGKEIPNDRWTPEGLNPYQMIKNPNTGELEPFNKSIGSVPQSTSTTRNKEQTIPSATTAHELYVSLNPSDRKELNDKLVPAFNKATEKTQQRLTHVPVIMERLKEAQTNAAALPQLKAELARFDVGDQRLAQQEFNMFGQRQGYKGWEDWLSNHTTGTITPDFAMNMAKAIQNVATDLQGELSNKAEEQANLLAKRNEANPQLAAQLIYGKYKPSQQSDKVKVKNLETGVVGMIPKANLQKALESKKYEQVQ